MNPAASRPRPPRRRSGGFTLIELLTVIAIIGILAAIVIPVVGKVRQSARKSQSLSNVKQIVQGLLTYANDNRGNLPRQGRDGNYTRPLWPQVVNAYLLGYNQEPANWDALKMSDVFFDPLLPDGYHSILSDYGNNTEVITLHPSPPFNLGSARSPSRLVAVATTQEIKSGATHGGWYINANYVANGATATSNAAVWGRDGGPAMLGFLDGHVRAVPMSELDTREKREALFLNRD
jgi:prepilin-type N-terminal cleavage/methylation domain